MRSYEREGKSLKVETRSHPLLKGGEVALQESRDPLKRRSIYMREGDIDIISTKLLEVGGGNAHPGKKRTPYLQQKKSIERRRNINGEDRDPVRIVVSLQISGKGSIRGGGELFVSRAASPPRQRGGGGNFNRR